MAASGSKTTAWVAGAGVVALVIGAGAWFGVIEPTFAAASDKLKDASDQRDHNDMLEMQIAQLEKEAEHLEDYRSELGDLRTQIPLTSDLSEALQQIEAQAAAAGVTITAHTSGSPTQYTPPAPEPTATPTPEPTETADSSEGSDSSSDSTQDAAAASDLYQMAFTVTTVGTYDQTVAFVDGLQLQMERLFVVSGLSFTTLEEAAADGGRPAVSAGDVETTITGAIYTLLSDIPTEPEDESTPAPTPTEVPAPNGQRNPFQPVG